MTTRSTDPEINFVDIGVSSITPSNVGGRGHRLLPKDFIPSASRCVYRKQQVEEILRKLEAAMVNQSIPGVYMSGPAGTGKSVLAYIITHLCKFDKGWMTIYIPDCRSWVAADSPVEAKGFFLDRVLDALSTKEMQDTFSACYKELNNPPVLDFAAPAGKTWMNVAESPANRDKVNILYAMVIAALQTTNARVLLVCDEVNALWGTGTQSRTQSWYAQKPWNLTMFQPTFLPNGALLLTGTTDNDYVRNIPNGLEKHIYQVGECTNSEIELMADLDEFEALRLIKTLDPYSYESIILAAGNIPRELRYYVDECSKSNLGKRVRDFLETGSDSDNDNDNDNDNEQAKKAAKSSLLQDVSHSIRAWRQSNVSRHLKMMNHALNQAGESTVFKEALFTACVSIFIKGKPARMVHEVLRVPNFVTKDSIMYPTTLDAQVVYFNWFCNEERKNKVEGSIARSLSDFLNASRGGERGNKFEEYLAAKLTVNGSGPNPKFYFRRLSGEDSTQCELPLIVKERVYTRTDNPPKNFQYLTDNTLLTHTDQNGGEARVDLIHYNKERVIYIEATVGNYGATKIPTLHDEKGREKLILETIQKWVGKDVFTVEVVPTPAHGQQLASAPKALSIQYRAKSNRERPDLPKLYYIVATTCPKEQQLAQDRIDKHSWINVCFLDDLITAGIFPADLKPVILAKQAT